MVAQFTFNSSSIQVKKAKLAKKLSPRFNFILLIVALLFVVGGATAVVVGMSLGYSVVAIGIPIGMLGIWNKWELQNLHGDITKLEKGKLELVLSPDALTLLSWPDNPREMWIKLQQNWETLFFLVRFGLDPHFFEQNLSNKSEDLAPILAQAGQISSELQQSQISSGAIAAALMANTPQLDQYLAQIHLGREDLISGLRWLFRVIRIIDNSSQKKYFGGLARDWTAGYTPTLNRVGRNLTSEVQSGAAYHGETNIRENIIDEMINVLSQPGRSSVALVGEDGIGKTLTVFSLAEKMLKGESKALQYEQIVMLDASALLASAQGQGQLEQLLLQIIGEAAHAKNIILFLDEAQLFFSQGTGALDLSNVLLPILQSNSIRMILAMNPQHWQKITANNSSLTNLIAYQAIKEPSESETIQMLQDETLLLEYRAGQAENLKITYQALQAAYKLSGRYVQDLAYPGRAIELLKSAMNHAEGGLVTGQSVATAVEATYGVKVGQADGEESEKLLNLEEELHKRMINQTRAVKVVSDAMRRSRAGVSSQNRPVGTFLFLGPTGVGKTELTKALADVYFGGRDKLVRVDMSEYSQDTDVSRLLDGGSGNTASTFLGQVRLQPFAVVLFDEIEKAHPDVLNLFLQLLDEGQLTDTQGRKVSFKDSIIISTSNAGADIIRAQIEAGKQLEQFEKQFEDQLINSGQFRPEFLNRFDEIVLFRPLTPEELKQVVQLLLLDVNQTIADKKVVLELSPAAVEVLVQKGYDPRLGARPMRRMMQRSVENVVAKRLLTGAIIPGEKVLLDVADLEVEQAASATTPAPNPVSPPSNNQ